MLTPSISYNNAILNPHKLSTVVRVFHGTQEVTPDGGLPLVDGSVTMNLSSRVTRSLTLQVPFAYYPHNPDDLLSPYRATLLVESGIEKLNGAAERFPVFTGRVYEARLDGEGAVTLRADDLAADVIAYRFETPFSVLPGFSVYNMIETLISDAINFPRFGPHDAPDALVPESLTWDEDRGKALDDLASSVGARWYALGNGSFVIRSLPYLQPQPSVFLTDGGYPDVAEGSLISAVKTITRDSTANSVVVNSERTDGSEPVHVVARDNGAGSPTQFGGLFGKVLTILSPQTPLTSAEAQTLANQQLSASLALTEQWDLSLVPLHFLEPGDQVRIQYRGVTADQIIDAITLPLTVGSAMTIRTRGANVVPSGDSS